MDKEVIRQVVLEQERARRVVGGGIERKRAVLLESQVSTPHVVIVSGLYGSCKSTLVQNILTKYYAEDFYFIGFGDERFVGFTTEDFNSLYEVLLELYGLRSVFFFDG